MPHKHKRRQKDSDAYDLPPNRIAKPLPVRDPLTANTPKPKGGPKNHNRKKPTGTARKENPQTKQPKPSPKDAAAAAAANSRPKSAFDDDDTPRAFRWLMQRQQSQSLSQGRKKNEGSGDEGGSDDDGVTSRSNKKRKRGGVEAGEGPQKKQQKQQQQQQQKQKQKKGGMDTATKQSNDDATNTTTAPLKILPGEKLSDFAARVNREMPLATMNRSSRPAAAELAKIREHKVTKHEKHLLRLQAMWRKEEAEILEKEAAQREEREEEMEEQLQLWKTWEAEAGQRKAKKKGSGTKKKGKQAGTESTVDDDPDPWAKLNKRDRVNKQLNPLDVVQAPPQLTKPREVFKIRGGAKVDVANVPAAVGSLRRREELATERRNIVEEYRRLMAEKRKAA
ncbi:uncharacterized protein BP01DRAFT_92175 [Aspergillus saccharolyticus JOP 1030-1]|uniref:Urease accessory protein UreD n=1 Tax=Aspergillus saccharolyticus JOP 1030-1 TaxID=1450539 RepID=A0A318Z9C4_9EURO|nr:hypothetical protein BP01DRAFT_92175 [Aspergillus saccharolyticus JOP 1030-1]PYH44001.1 hypothetical protein BP01DRAFT_92175 [Aspergillus saccharolyticus JOP 1030-1]